VQNFSLLKESRRIKYRLMWSYERELREKRRGWWDDQWLGDNRRELVGIKRYLSTLKKVSFLPNLQVSRGDFYVGLRML
jgi:hypothetical protein